MKLKLDLSGVGDLGYGEWLDACDVIGIDAEKVDTLTGNKQKRYMIALAWVMARRDNPTLTWAEVQRAQLEVGEPAAINPPEDVASEPSPASLSRRTTPPLKSVG